MEILNKNQRRSAIWKLAILGAVILLLLLTTCVAMHQEYANQGVEEWQQMKEECQQQIHTLKGERQHAMIENQKLNEEIQKLKDNMGKPSETMQILEQRLEMQKERADEYENKYNAELARRESVEADLRACKSE